MDVSYFKTPTGDEMAVLSRKDFEAIVDQLNEGLDVKQAQDVIEGIRKGEETYPHEVIELELVKGLSLVASWRTYKGVSQKQLADKLGITQSAIAQIEKPEATPQIKTIKKIAKALDIDVEQLTD